MKAVRIREYGDASVVFVDPDVPKPGIGDGQVLVEVQAASLNPIDSAVRLGYLQQMVPLRLPATLGTDLAGVVVEAGPGVRGLQPGDKVYGLAGLLSGGSGAFAEYAAAEVGKLARMPQNLGFVEAASLPLAAVSALQAIEEALKLQSGQRILVHGGAGGIGTIAIQLARHRGARVAATVRGEGADYARSLGAEEVIDVQTNAFDALLKDYDAVLDTVGGETYRRSFAVLRKGGTIVSMLEQPDTKLAARYGVTALGQMTEVNTARLERVSELVKTGTIKVHVKRVFPLEKARDAFLAREGGKSRGKIVLRVR